MRTAERDVPYDFLILAAGSTSHFFGLPGAAEHAWPPRTLEQGIALRNRILCCFERAVHEPDPGRRGRLLSFVIVGDGPTGWVLLWLGVHITNLIGFRNRLFVLINWAWDYIWYERGVRLILPSPRQADARRSENVAP